MKTLLLLLACLSIVSCSRVDPGSDSSPSEPSPEVGVLSETKAVDEVIAPEAEASVPLDRPPLPSRQADGLNIGVIEPLGTDEPSELPEDCKPLAHILSGVLDDLGKLYDTLDKRYEDAGWVAYRYAEILPISAEQKQRCLETEDPLERLVMMREVLKSVRGP